jgi:4-amino-4-deoxy-L-arabinose transferase-like glycosyltransferase
LNKKHIVLFLILICVISLGLKLYTFDPSVTPSEDTYGYVLRAIAHNNGDFTEHPRKTLGWSLVISPFLHLVESDDFLDYVNVARYLGIIISIISIYPMYLLGRRFFNEKFALCAAGFFAFEPHLNYHASSGYTEPLYFLILILATYFILKKNSNLSYLSFVSLSMLWYVHWSGIIFFITLSLIFFLNNKKSKKLFLKYFLCIGIFILVASPMLINRYEEYGDPLFFSQSSTVFVGNPAVILADNTKNLNYSYQDYIQENGIYQFIHTFIILGISNIVSALIRISLPYLIIFLPFGILFSFKAFNQEKNFIRSNWIMILIPILSMICYFGVWPDKRLLYPIFPFLIILSIIPLQRLIVYGLSTFSFSKKQKNLFLLGIIIVIILLSCVFTLRYGQPDQVLDKEKIEFAEMLLNNFEGKILDADFTLEGLHYAKLSDHQEISKDFTVNLDRNSINGTQKLLEAKIYAENIHEFMLESEKYNVQYISISKDGIESTNFWYPYLIDLYRNEEDYTFLTKVFDSSQNGYEKFHVKIFKLNFSKYHDSYP